MERACPMTLASVEQITQGSRIAKTQIAILISSRFQPLLAVAGSKITALFVDK